MSERVAAINVGVGLGGAAAFLASGAVVLFWNLEMGVVGGLTAGKVEFVNDAMAASILGVAGLFGLLALVKLRQLRARYPTRS